MVYLRDLRFAGILSYPLVRSARRVQEHEDKGSLTAPLRSPHGYISESEPGDGLVRMQGGLRDHPHEEYQDAIHYICHFL